MRFFVLWRRIPFVSLVVIFLLGSTTISVTTTTNPNNHDSNNIINEDASTAISQQPWHQKCLSLFQQLEQHRKNVEQFLVNAVRAHFAKHDQKLISSSNKQRVSDRPWWHIHYHHHHHNHHQQQQRRREKQPKLSASLPAEATTATTTPSSSASSHDWSWILPRRMSRACHRLYDDTIIHTAAETTTTKTASHESQPQEQDNENDEEKEHDLLLDPTFLSSSFYPEFVPQPQTSLLWKQSDSSASSSSSSSSGEYYYYRATCLAEPFAGMELQVYHEEEQCFPVADTNAVSAEADPSLLQHHQFQYQQQFACVGDDMNLELISSKRRNNLFADSYILLEPLHLQLGMIPKHTLDYAYKPVVADASLVHPSMTTTPSQQQQQQQHQVMEEVVVVDDYIDDNNSNHKQIHAAKHSTIVGNAGPAFEASAWWRWWFPFSNSWWKDASHDDAGYDRSGKSAFAGGSHGEVWRGRRKCSASARLMESEQHPCDDQQSLVLKRLKVEHGYRLLEAGLREVYFGNMLTNQLKAQGLFTAYVDHFFREIPRPAFVGRPPSKDLELWIVFEDAGPSLRSYLYSAITTGDFVVYQQSALWYTLRMGSRASTSAAYNDKKSVAIVSEEHRRNRTVPRTAATSGRELMAEVLRQILTSAAYLHEHGIVHRDIKPSNVMCRAGLDITKSRAVVENMDISKVHCVLGDFSSAWNNFTAQNLYTNGPSQAEQTDEYAPPEALLGPSWVPFHEHKPQSYDSWSIGVLALELMLGTPNVFSVDQRTTVLLSNKMRKAGASAEELQRALYLAALSQFCIYMPAATNSSKNGSWPMRRGEPLHNISMAKQSCTLHDFHRALRARDPLGIGFDSSADSLLRLIWELLAWNPMDRITAAEALKHPFFTNGPSDKSVDIVAGSHNALESQMLDPRFDFNLSDTVTEFVCPKCGRKFDNWRSCQMHTVSRRHAQFCEFDRRSLPTCLNAHVMLPAHPTSGYCDIQGRRRVIEDFHAIHLHPSHQFYGVFDGHTGNLASKFAASSFYEHLSKRLANVDEEARVHTEWKNHVLGNMTESFAQVHDSFLQAVALAPHGMMDQSGTTATTVFVTSTTVIVASIGDSRAVVSSKGDGRRMGAIQLTVDHVASNDAERLMVEARGGHVVVSGGMARVNGTLAITRSIGDADLAPILSRTPHVVALLKSEISELCGIAPSDLLPCFIVLATDGLWDVITNEEAVNMVAQVVVSYDNEVTGLSWEEGGAFQKAAERLTQEAYVRGSTDNIGVCVIAID